VAIAKALGWPTGELDKDRAKRRQERGKAANDPAISGVVIEPWPHEVKDLGAVLDAAVAQLQRFLVAPDPSHFDTVALWSAHTHLLDKEALEVVFTPRLAFQSPTKRCGKSTGLKCTYLMAHNARMASSISPSSLFRAVDALRVSIMIDEGDNVFKNVNPDLLSITNAGADKMTAKVMRSEATGDGQFISREFNTFGALALTSIQPVPDTLQDRCIALPMRRAMKHERPERLTMRTRGPLIDIGRQFARWAADLKVLPNPTTLADLFNRIEDRWFTLFQIALAAGGDWPERCKRAALADLKREEANDADGGAEGDLLGDIWRVFHEKGVARLHTEELCDALLALSEAPWASANRGGEITSYYLRKHLHDFLPEDADKVALRQWRDANGQKVRGYHELHFQDAFERYLGKGLPSKEPKSPPPSPDTPPPGGSKHAGHQGHPRQNDEMPVKSSTNAASDTSPVSGAASGAAATPLHAHEFAPDAAPDAPPPCGADNAELDQSVTGNALDAPDAPDTLDPHAGVFVASNANADGSTSNPKSKEKRPRAKSNGSGVETPEIATTSAVYPRAGRGRGKAPRRPDA
jgi:hypothetical protein